MSNAHPAVVRNAPVKYRRDIIGISMYLHDHGCCNIILIVSQQGNETQKSIGHTRIDCRTHHDMKSNPSPTSPMAPAFPMSMP